MPLTGPANTDGHAEILNNPNDNTFTKRIDWILTNESEHHDAQLAVLNKFANGLWASDHGGVLSVLNVPGREQEEVVVAVEQVATVQEVETQRPGPRRARPLFLPNFAAGTVQSHHRSATLPLRFLRRVSRRPTQKQNKLWRNDSGKDDRNRPGHDELGHGGDGGRRADGARERRGRPHYPLRRRLHRLRRAPGRHGRQAPGRDEPREHDLLDQALHGPQGGRGQGGGDDRPLQGRRRPERRRPHRRGRQAVLPAGDLGDDPAEAQGRRRGQARRAGRLGRDHRPGLLQRRPAPGDQGRRQDRRARRQADHQRADRRVARLRARQGVRPDDPRLRPRWRHLRRLRARDRRRRLRGQVDRR